MVRLDREHYREWIAQEIRANKTDSEIIAALKELDRMPRPDQIYQGYVGGVKNAIKKGDDLEFGFVRPS